MSVGGKSEDGIISRYINRRVSTQISRFILNRWSDPNPYIATLVSLAVGLLSAYYYFIGFHILAGILVQLASILDGVDGELARATDKTSELGGFIDTVLDRVVDFSVLLSIFYFTLTTDLYYDKVTFVLLLISIFGWFMVSYVHSLIRDVGLKGKVGVGFRRFASRDVRIFILFLFSLFSVSHLGVIVSGLLSLVYVAYLVYATASLLK